MTRTGAVVSAGLLWFLAVVTVLALGALLEAHDVSIAPVMHGYAGVVGGPAALVVMMMTAVAVLVLGLLAAGLIAGVGRTPRACLVGAAVGLQALNLAQVTMGQSAGLLALLLGVGAALVLCSLAGTRAVPVAAIALIAVTLVAFVARVAPEVAAQAEDSAKQQLNDGLKDAALANDTATIDRLLQHGPLFVDWALWDIAADEKGTAAPAKHILASAEVEQTDCVKQLKAVGTAAFPPDVSFLRSDAPISWRCREATAQLAAMLGDSKAIAAVFDAEPKLNGSVVGNLLRTKRFGLLRAALDAGLLGDDGKLRESLYLDEDFIRETLYHCDSDEQWAALMPYLDRTRALCALIAAKHDWLARKMLAQGADPNGPGVCNVTPLAVLLGKGDPGSDELLDALLDGGANPKRAAPYECDGGVELPVRWLAKRYEEHQGTPTQSLLRVLVQHHAVDAESARVFAKDSDYAEILDGGG